jgi:uncharacterized repeat protein (TIGR01451 family)
MEVELSRVTRSWRDRILGVLGVGVALLVIPAGTALADTTVGATGGGTGLTALCVATSVAADTGYVVPAGGGTIDSFAFQTTTNNGIGTQRLDFLVLRPTTGTNYTVVGKSGLTTLNGTAGTQTIPVSPGIAVQQGDVLGVFVGSLAVANCTRSSSDTIRFKLGLTDPAVGASVNLNTGTLARSLNESAHLVQPADLKLTKTAAPTTVLHNQNVTYTIKVENLSMGTASAAAPTVVDTLPIGQTYVSDTATPACTTTGTGAVGDPVIVTCASSSALPAQSSYTFTIVAKAGLVGNGQVNTATVSSTTADPVAGNNTGTATVDVVAAADLSIVKTASPDPVIAGQQLTYTLTVHNAGPDTAVAPTVTDVLPPGTTFQGASPGCTNAAGTVTCTLADLPAGQDAVVQIVVLASADPTSNTASVAATTADPDTSNNSSTISTTVSPSCTQTLSGPQAASITVRSGQFLCLTNATVAGSVTIDAGGALTSTNSTIGGALISNGAQFVTLCGSTFRSSVSVKNTTLLARVGDDDSSCAGNRITGSLTVTGNTGGVEVYGNTVGGAASVKDNTGASPLADAAPEVEGNTVTGSLSCSGNTPPPVNDGLVNHAAVKLDQCAAL